MRLINRASRAAKRYLGEVRYCLPCSFKTKRDLLKRLQYALLDYIEERPHSSYEDLVEHFGQPTAVADAYFANLPPDQFRNTLHTARFVCRVLITVSVLMLLLYGVTLGFMMHYM